MAEARGVSKRFGGVIALDGVSISLKCGQVCAIIGPNGAGKTTLLNVMSGFLVPDAGCCYLRGNDVTLAGPETLARQGVMRTFQSVRVLLSATVLDNVVLMHRDRRGEAIHDLLRPRSLRLVEAVRVAEARNALGQVGLLEKQQAVANALSYGERKLLVLAAALVARPKVMLLDEPFGGLDGRLIDGVAAILRGLSREGVAVTFIEHDLAAVAAAADWVVVMSQGRLVLQGQAESLLNSTDLMDAYVG